MKKIAWLLPVAVLSMPLPALARDKIAVAASLFDRYDVNEKWAQLPPGQTWGEGGTVGDLTQTVHGMTHFVPGERAVVFLAGRPERASVVGMAQGKRLVRRDAGSGRMLVHAPDKAGATFIRTTPASATSPVFDLRARPLEDLRAEVRTLATKPDTTKPDPSKAGPR